MGAIWLLNLVTWFVDAGIRATGYPGWQMRSRSSGGFDRIAGIIIHHDAGPTWLSELRRVQLEYDELQYAPVGNIHIHRDGTVTVGAAGAANTAGRGGPLTGSRGVIAVDTANRVTINIEASNNGIDEDWPQAQLDAYIAVIAVLCIRLDLDPLRDVWDHREWTTRKIDVGGGRCVFAANGTGKWDMNRVRSAVAAKVAELTAPPPPPQEDDMWTPIDEVDVRFDRTIDPHELVPLEHGALKGATRARFAVHVLDGDGGAWLTNRHANGWRGVGSTAMYFDGAGHTTTVEIPVVESDAKIGRCWVSLKRIAGADPYRLIFDLVAVQR